MENKGKIVLIGCGGAGVSIVGNLHEHLMELGNGFSKVEVEYVDTSTANVKNFKYNEDNFYHIKSTKVGEEISGSAAERRENAEHISAGMIGYMNDKKFDSGELATYYVLIGSASGGSGSVILPNLLKHLLDKNIPVLPILVGDTSNDQYTDNTLWTLASMNGVVNVTGKPVTMLYRDNMKAVDNKGGTSSKRDIVDKEIFNKLSVLSAFLSGDASDIDQKDMAAFIDQSIYKKRPIKPGLYMLDVAIGDVKLPTHLTLTGVRTLTTKDISPDITELVPKHNKTGTTRNQNVIETYKGQFPIHLISYANAFSAIEGELKDLLAKADEGLANATVDDIKVESEPDKNGIVI